MLNLMGTIETSAYRSHGHTMPCSLLNAAVNKAKRRYTHMVRFQLGFARDYFPHAVAQFPSVLFGMLCSTIPVSIIGIRYAMAVDPFWKPEQYSPSTSLPLLSFHA